MNSTNNYIEPTQQMTSRTDWFCVGKASTFENLASSNRSGTETTLAGQCKAFLIPQEGQEATECTGGSVHNQVIVFAYKGRIHAMDHSCPHSSYPLSRGTVFDIEDFGVVLSAGLTCAKHGWSFDLFSGRGDRGNYRLGLWDVDLRGDEGADKEVWVKRRKAP
ncbi:hypothetical protein CP532_3785 [Ophiocordyceps camponoti-leonardi (nom. inval.)]|nr:hypothetical protein CP532_3785 [Ophiocordyceps camponoti-leonardi (nom. inval.)]